MPARDFTTKLSAMFSVDEPTAAAIRRAYEEDGDLASIVELRRHFPLITDHAKARECVQMILSWKPLPDRPQKRVNSRRITARPIRQE